MKVLHLTVKYDESVHCEKGVRIRSVSGTYFPAFRLNMEIYRVNLRIQSECWKIRTRKTPNIDTFHAVWKFGKNPKYQIEA